MKSIIEDMEDIDIKSGKDHVEISKDRITYPGK